MSFLYLLLVFILEACSHASATIGTQFYRTNSTLADKDLAVATQQLSLDATAMSRRTCAAFCMSKGANCNEFSIHRPETGLATCKIGNKNASATIGAPGVHVYIVGLPTKNVFESCRNSSLCPTNAHCSGGICICIAGFEAFNGNEGCTAIPPVDASGFQHYLDGFAYKRVPGGATSLSGAKTSCTGIGAALPIPYGASGDGVKSLQALRTFARPGEEFYIGLTATGAYSARTFITSNGIIVDAKAKSTDAAQFWAPNEPNATADINAAAVTMTTSGWQDKASNTMVSTVICSKWSGYTFNSISGKYYKMYLGASTNTNADLVCRSEGGTLAITHGAVGSQIMRYYFDAYGVQFWLAGRDSAQEGLWVFPDGTILDATQKGTDTRQNWVNPEPNGGTGDNCLLVWNYGWADNPCSTWARPFLCEKNL